MSSPLVSHLVVYPIKSARGIAVGEARLTDRGFEHDRRFLITHPEGRFITQREHPTLALLRVEINGDRLVLASPSSGRLEVPLRPRSGAPRRVTVWAATCDAISLGDEAARFVTGHLGVPCELVHMPDDSVRLVDDAYAGAGERVGFADGFPFLLTSEASLADLNARLASPVPMDRFRPNLVVTGSAPFDEDRWRSLAIGEVTFRVAKACDRCQITTVDQATAERGIEPLATLAGFRAEGRKVLFGQYLLHAGTGVIRRGDRVSLLA
jgi:hypothetical protein